MTDAAPESPLAAVRRAYVEQLLRRDQLAAARIALAAADRFDIRDIYLDVFQAALWECGRLWEENRISVAQEHYFAAATQSIMSQLCPRIFGKPRLERRLVATCVSGESHQVGCRMVADLAELAGWDTFFLGGDTPTSSIVQFLCEQPADILAVSVTMPHHIERVPELISAVRATAPCRRVGILVGGQAFNADPGLWRALGADASAANAVGAVSVATALADERDASFRS